jgi:hypothetical protein
LFRITAAAATTTTTTTATTTTTTTNTLQERSSTYALFTARPQLVRPPKPALSRLPNPLTGESLCHVILFTRRMELQVAHVFDCFIPSYRFNIVVISMFFNSLRLRNLLLLLNCLQREDISKALTQIIKRERVWDKINRILAAYPLRAFASMHIQEVASSHSSFPTFTILIFFIFNIHHIHFFVFLFTILFSSSRSSFTFCLFQIEKLRFEFESCYPALCTATGSVISAIQKWRQNFERTMPFMWRDQDYMVRMLGQVKQNMSPR